MRPLQAAKPNMGAQTCAERVRRVKQLHPSAVQAVLPDWFPVTNEAAHRLRPVARQLMPELSEGESR